MPNPPPLPPRRNVPPRPLLDTARVDRDLLLRRFNREVRHVRAIDSSAPESRLYDLRVSPDQALSAEKLRSNIERTVLYSKQINHAVRRVAALRDWNDWKCGTLGSIYFVAWWNGFLAIALAMLAAVLLLSPDARTRLFPPLLEISNDVVAKKSISSTEEPRATDRENAGMTEGERDDAEVATLTAELEDIYSQRIQIPLEDVVALEEGSTVPPLETTTLVKKDSKLLPIQVITGDLADSYEVWINAFDSTSTAPRRLALFLLPVGLALSLLPTRLLIKAVTFTVGVIIFGKPLLSRAGDIMERKYGPRWKETLELRNSLLSDSKTNAQTMLSLLREGELRNQPLSPPAPLLTSVATPPLPSSSTFATATEGSASTSRAEVSSPRAGTAKSKLGTAMRLASKGFEQSAGIISGQKKVDWENLSQLAIEKLRTSTGSDLPGLLSYAVPASSMPSDTSSISFYAHHKGKPGHLLLHPPRRNDPDSVWTVGFAPISSSADSTPVKISIDSICGLNKVAALGWKARLAAGWMTGAELGTGIELVGEGGEKYNFAAVLRRDEVFNRLIAIGKDVAWESY